MTPGPRWPTSPRRVEVRRTGSCSTSTTATPQRGRSGLAVCGRCRCWCARSTRRTSSSAPDRPLAGRLRGTDERPHHRGPTAASPGSRPGRGVGAFWRGPAVLAPPPTGVPGADGGVGVSSRRCCTWAPWVSPGQPDRQGWDLGRRRGAVRRLRRSGGCSRPPPCRPRWGVDLPGHGGGEVAAPSTTPCSPPPSASTTSCRDLFYISCGRPIATSFFLVVGTVLGAFTSPWACSTSRSRSFAPRRSPLRSWPSLPGRRTTARSTSSSGFGVVRCSCSRHLLPDQPAARVAPAGGLGRLRCGTRPQLCRDLRPGAGSTRSGPAGKPAVPVRVGGGRLWLAFGSYRSRLVNEGAVTPTPTASLLRQGHPVPAGAGMARTLVRRNITAWKHAWPTSSAGSSTGVLPVLLGSASAPSVGQVEVANHQTVSYAVFVAPALLASSAMNGAVFGHHRERLLQASSRQALRQRAGHPARAPGRRRR